MWKRNLDLPLGVNVERIFVMLTKNRLDGELFVVKDAMGMAMYLVISVVMGILAVYFLFSFALIVACIFALASYVFYRMVKVGDEGHIIDIKNDIYSYPGGKSADEMSDYISKEWWLQSLGFKRGSIKLSEITRVTKGESTRYANNRRYTCDYSISIQGTFGNITQTFSDGGKRDQLYSIFAQVLNLGNPVIVR